MSEFMLGILGFITIIAIIVLLLKSKTVPMMAFIVVPTIAAAVLVLTGTYTISEIGDFISAGISGTSSTACLFVFSIMFFGIMTDAGMFDRIIGALMSKVGDSVTGVLMMTALIAMVAHLDGGGASTFLITIPAMLPIYKKMHIRKTTLLTICVTSMGVMNLLPWGGPTMRAASVLGIEANALWRELIPIQIVGIVLAFLVAFLHSRIELKLGAGLNGRLALEDPVEITEDPAEKAAANELHRPKLFWFNIALTLVVIVCLVALDVPSHYIFMVGTAVALLVNYPGTKLQNQIIKSHAGPAITMAGTLFTAGVLLGVLEESGIMDCMANILVGIIPNALGPYLPLVIGVLSVPLTLAFCTDSFFYGLLPVMIGVGEKFGVDPIQIAISMVICRNCATFISPVVPATFLGTGLAEVEIQDHIKHSFLWVWAVSIICLIAGLLFGILTI